MTDLKSKNNITDKAKDFVKHHFKKISSSYTYHNFKHSEMVVNACAKLASDFNLSDNEKEILSLAGWFHDIAYSEKCEGHEDLAAEKAKDFLLGESYSLENTDKVVACILATKMEYVPQNLMEMIMKDADSAHLGKKSFEKRSALLRMEWELVNNKVYSEKEWMEVNLEFMQKHQFYTSIAKTEWSSAKEKQVKILDKKLKSFLDLKDEHNQPEIDNITNEVKRSRGVETMFRTTLRNHISLSRIADNKANFLLSINAIIVSLLLGELVTDNKPVFILILPSIYFLVVCSITMILSILAARPNITKGKFSREGLLNKKVNILFFGNFHKMPLEEFDWGINELMKNDDLLYNSLTKDLYFLGQVLHKKYQLLRYAFTFFMFGIISSLLFFIIVMIINN